MKRGFHIVLALILASLPTVASADILQWTDTAGVTHYTNLKAEVPAHEVAQVVVDEQVWVPPQAPAEPIAKDAPVADPPPPRDTEDEVARAYIAGLNSGLADNVSTGGSVYISGPLAVTIAAPAPYGSYVLPAYDWLPQSYYPYLTTSVIERHRGPRGGRFGNGFRGRVAFTQGFTGPAGPPPIGAAGRPPIGAAGPPPVGAAGRPPIGGSGSRLAR